jgi:uncharacterized protein (DUF302 family)
MNAIALDQCPPPDNRYERRGSDDTDRVGAAHLWELVEAGYAAVRRTAECQRRDIRMLKHVIAAIACMIAVPMVSHAANTAATTTYQKGVFSDVRQDVADGIVNRGFVIDYTAHIGEMLKRTAKDFGETKPLYANAEGLQFCSARLSREMFAAEPANIALCPYVLVVYEMADKPGVIHVGFRKMPASGSARSRKATTAIEKMLDEIARSATR